MIIKYNIFYYYLFLNNNIYIKKYLLKMNNFSFLIYIFHLLFNFKLFLLNKLQNKKIKNKKKN